MNFETRSSAFLDNGIGPIIQKTLNTGNSEKKRTLILERYMQGEWLTAEELRYLMLTSVSLEQFINKKYLQNIANLLDPKFIKNVKKLISLNIFFKKKN